MALHQSPGPERKLVDTMLKDIRQYKELMTVAAPIQFISKAWQAAVKDFPASIECGNPEDLPKICTALPSMSSLILKYQPTGEAAYPSLSPLSTCSKLRHLTVDQQQLDQELGDGLNLCHLPEYLCSLGLVEATLDASQLIDVYLPRLIKLSLTDSALHLPGIHSLLQRLPSLEVSNFDQTVHVWQSDWQSSSQNLNYKSGLATMVSGPVIISSVS